MKVISESEITESCPTFSDPMACSLSGSSVHGISRQEYWSGVPLPSLDSGITLTFYLTVLTELNFILHFVSKSQVLPILQE